MVACLLIYRESNQEFFFMKIIIMVFITWNLFSYLSLLLLFHNPLYYFSSLLLCSINLLLPILLLPPYLILILLQPIFTATVILYSVLKITLYPALIERLLFYSILFHSFITQSLTHAHTLLHLSFTSTSIFKTTVLLCSALTLYTLRGGPITRKAWRIMRWWRLRNIHRDSSLCGSK